MPLVRLEPWKVSLSCQKDNNLFPGTWLSMNIEIRQTILILPSLGAATPGVFSLSAILLEKALNMSGFL